MKRPGRKGGKQRAPAGFPRKVRLAYVAHFPRLFDVAEVVRIGEHDVHNQGDPELPRAA
jgi:hypothetical protein